MTLSEEVIKFKTMFDEINADEEADFVPYSDVEFYAEQVFILNNEQDYEHALKIAKLLAK